MSDTFQTPIDILLAAVGHFNRLNLSKNKKLNQKITRDFTFKYLDALDLSESNITDENLIEILKKANSLKELNIAGCRYLNSHRIDEYNLNSLEKLKCTINMTPEQVSKILKNAPNLKELFLGRLPKLSDENIDELNLTPLKNINILVGDMEDKKLVKIFSKATALEEIVLQHFKILNADMDYNFDLSSLKSLSLDYVHISPQNLTKILNKAGQLKELFLSCMDLKNLIEDDLKLDSLTKIELFNARIGVEDFNKLLKKASNLEEIHLDSYVNLTDTIDYDFNLKKLRKLVMKSPKMSPKNLIKILNEGSKLEELYMVCDHTLLFDQNLLDAIINHVDLKSLKSIKFDRNIDHKKIATILEKCSNLKELELELYDSIKLSQEIIDNLNSLETLKLSNGILDIEKLSQILKKAPNLKTIEISEFAEFNEEEVLDILKYKRIVLVYHGSDQEKYEFFRRNMLKQEQERLVSLGEKLAKSKVPYKCLQKCVLFSQKNLDKENFIVINNGYNVLSQSELIAFNIMMDHKSVTNNSCDAKKQENINNDNKPSSYSL